RHPARDRRCERVLHHAALPALLQGTTRGSSSQVLKAQRGSGRATRVSSLALRLFEAAQRGFYVGRFEPERARLAFVGDLPAGIDDVEPIGPASIRAFDVVVGIVDDGRQLDPEIADAQTCRVESLIAGDRAVA